MVAEVELNAVYCTEHCVAQESSAQARVTTKLTSTSTKRSYINIPLIRLESDRHNSIGILFMTHRSKDHIQSLGRFYICYLLMRSMLPY